MEYSLSSSLVGGSGSLNPDKLSLDLPFATTKSLTAAKGPTPTFVRASTGTYFGNDGYLKSAANNVARFDHETSYAGSTILVQCIDCVDVYSNVFSAAERIPLNGIDVDGYPYFIGSLFTVSYDQSASEWLLSYNSGDFEAYSTAVLSGDYTPYGTIGGLATVTAELACKGLLIEESSANLVTYSQLLTNVSWVTTGTTASAVGIGPNTATAFEVAETSASSGHNIINSGGLTITPVVSYTSGSSYTFSIFAKKSAGSVDWIQLTASFVPFGAAQHANFNIGTGVVGYFTGTPAGFPPKIESVGNGWYRCSLTLVATATAVGNAITVLFTNNTDTTTRAPSYPGNTANKVFLTMAQAEQKAFPTSYIPTTSGTAPRSADLCEFTGSAFTSFYNQPAGTIIVDGYSSNGSQPRFTSFGPNLQRTFELFKSASNLSYYNGTDVLIKSAATFPSKFGVAMTSNDAQGVFNGVLGGVNTAFSMKSPNSMTIGTYFDYSFPLNGCIRSIKYYKKRLTNAKLQSLTT